MQDSEQKSDSTPAPSQSNSSGNVQPAFTYNGSFVDTEQPDVNRPQDTFSGVGPVPEEAKIEWSSAEQLTYNNKPARLLLFGIGAAVLSAIVYLLNKDIITAVLVFLALVGIIYFNSRQPKEQHHVLSSTGIKAGQTFYAFNSFRGFTVVSEGRADRLVLIPMRRFMPAINILLPDERIEEILKFVADRLPMDQREPDLAEKIISRLKF